jgi:hypothetical protein
MSSCLCKWVEGAGFPIQIEFLSSVTANELDASLKETEEGWLSEHGIRAA